MVVWVQCNHILGWLPPRLQIRDELTGIGLVLLYPVFYRRRARESDSKVRAYLESDIEAGRLEIRENMY